MADKIKEKIRKLQEKMQQSLHDSFAKYDTNGDGKISLTELKEVCRQKKIKFDDKLYAKLDRDGDGKISASEFTKMFSVEHKWKLRQKV